jgi:hypothetical protein
MLVALVLRNQPIVLADGLDAGGSRVRITPNDRAGVEKSPGPPFRWRRRRVPVP